jgi:tungstate transport system ATP-binding protein
MLDRPNFPHPAHTAVLPITFADVSYAVRQRSIVSHIDLKIEHGPPTVVVGPNGAGKSTLIKLAMGLLTPTTGRLTFAGRDIAPPGSRALVLQKPVMLRRTVSENIAFALRSVGQPADGARIEALLAVSGMSGMADRPARRLSGGEQQRVALARALARQPDVLLLDEPTASLDPAAAKRFEDIVAEAALGGTKILMSTHDLGQARRLAGDVVFMARGHIVEHAPASVFFTNAATEDARRFLAGELVI